MIICPQGHGLQGFWLEILELLGEKQDFFSWHGKLNLGYDRSWFLKLDKYLWEKEKVQPKDIFEGNGDRLLSADELGVCLKTVDRITN